MFVSDTLKALKQHLKQMHHFFTDDNLITTFYSVLIQPHQMVASLLTDIES